jgi:hypothetical protein
MKEEGRRKKEEGRRKKEEGRRSWGLKPQLKTGNLDSVGVLKRTVRIKLITPPTDTTVSALL